MYVNNLYRDVTKTTLARCNSANSKLVNNRHKSTVCRNLSLDKSVFVQIQSIPNVHQLTLKPYNTRSASKFERCCFQN